MSHLRAPDGTVLCDHDAPHEPDEHPHAHHRGEHGHSHGLVDRSILRSRAACSPTRSTTSATR